MLILILMTFPEIVSKIIEVAPPLLIAVILHEIAHGYVAEKLGDPTAREANRINLNPIVHIDLFFTIILPVLLILSNTGIVFGGAKPVPVNPNYFKNPRKGMLWVALAGPVSNVIIAIISYLLLLAFDPVSVFLPESLSKLLGIWLVSSIFINIVLAIFNLIPIPPLDGGRIVVGVLPEKLAYTYAKLEPYGFFILVAILYAEIPQKIILPVILFIQEVLF